MAKRKTKKKAAKKKAAKRKAPKRKATKKSRKKKGENMKRTRSHQEHDKRRINRILASREERGKLKTLSEEEFRRILNARKGNNQQPSKRG